jgi:peroxin-6
MQVSKSDSGDMPTEEDDPDSVVVEYVDFIKAMDQLSPSLSITELKKYEMLRDQFQGRSS